MMQHYQWQEFKTAARAAGVEPDFHTHAVRIAEEQARILKEWRQAGLPFRATTEQEATIAACDRVLAEIQIQKRGTAA